MVRLHASNSGLSHIAAICRFSIRFQLTKLYRSFTRITKVAEENGIALRQGVYIMYSGPNYETPAEIRMFRMMGADAVGMSTVPEAIVAAHCGMDVVGISCITNMAAGVLPQKLNHQEVVETAALVHDKFQKLLTLVIDLLDR